MKNKKRITIGVVVVLLALAAILAVIMLKKFAPNKTHMSLTKYFQVTDQGMMPVVLEMLYVDLNDSTNKVLFM